MTRSFVIPLVTIINALFVIPGLAAAFATTNTLTVDDLLVFLMAREQQVRSLSYDFNMEQARYFKDASWPASRAFHAINHSGSVVSMGQNFRLHFTPKLPGKAQPNASQGATEMTFDGVETRYYDTASRLGQLQGGDTRRGDGLYLNPLQRMISAPIGDGNVSDYIKEVLKANSANVRLDRVDESGILTLWTPAVIFTFDLSRGCLPLSRVRYNEKVEPTSAITLSNFVQVDKLWMPHTMVFALFKDNPLGGRDKSEETTTTISNLRINSPEVTTSTFRLEFPDDVTYYDSIHGVRVDSKSGILAKRKEHIAAIAKRTTSTRVAASLKSPTMTERIANHAYWGYLVAAVCVIFTGVMWIRNKNN